MWLTRLEFDAINPLLRHWFDAVGERGRDMRYDARERGLSERALVEISFDRWVVDDLEAVAASVSDDPVNVLGFSQGAAAAIGFAVSRPGRVARLILHGGFAAVRRARPGRGDDTADRHSGGRTPAMVAHHVGSKEGLREGVDQHVLYLFDRQCVNLRTARDARQRSRSLDGGGAEHQVSGSVRRVPRASHA